MLEVKKLAVNYGAINALQEVSLTVRRGDIVTLIGSNGAGKTTTLKTISGLLKARSGGILYEGRNVANLTVLENLKMGAYLQKDREAIQRQMDYVFGVFPRLKERLKQIAGTLSGGEQQMLAIGRALMSKPRFLMLDEPSLGIAPLLVKTIFEKIVEVNQRQGITILLVEQNANLALQVSRYGYVLETGRITLHDESAALRQNPQVRKAYLGG